MELLKEDGSLDIEKLDALPLEEHIRAYERLTREQKNEYWEKHPINESKDSTRAVIVDYTFEDEIKRGTGVDAIDFLNKQREKYGLTK